MAVSKSTRRSVSDTSQQIQDIFPASQVSEERERAWHRAVRHSETGAPPLRFPVYGPLYFLNLYAQKMVDLLKEVGGTFGIGEELSLYNQLLVQQVRSTISSQVLEYMAGIEHTDAWLFESRRKIEETNLRDPDDVYFVVRDRERERIKQGLAPRIRFLDEVSASKSKPVKTAKTNKAN
jgi:hypothetical protein